MLTQPSYPSIILSSLTCLLAENLDSDKEELPLFIISVIETGL